MADPRSLRRHYPHQVQGVVPTSGPLSHSAPPQYLFQNKTRPAQVNASKNGGGVSIKRRIPKKRSLRRAPLQL